MIESIPDEAKGGAIAGLFLLGIAILRKIGLRASKDMITLQADAADLDSFKRLKTRVEELDGRLRDMEAVRNQLLAFGLKCMTYIAQCQCDDAEGTEARHELRAEYERLIQALAEGGRATDQKS